MLTRRPLVVANRRRGAHCSAVAAEVGRSLLDDFSTARAVDRDLAADLGPRKFVNVVAVRRRGFSVFCGHDHYLIRFFRRRTDSVRNSASPSADIPG